MNLMHAFKKVISIIGVLIFSSSCLNSVSQEELSRITSPDSLVDAVVIRINSGATASYAYKLYIVLKGKKVDSNNELFKADNVVDLQIRWEKPLLLAISYGLKSLSDITILYC